MNKEEIKKAVQLRYDIIKMCESDLAIIREKCNHEETENIDYMWAPGHIMAGALVCSICGKLIT